MRNIVLVGYMGSGKSTVGKALAFNLNREFIDLDQFIVQREEHSVSEIFKLKGEIYFRKKELEFLKEILQSDGDKVIALGGGTPCYGDTMQIITSQENTISFYIKQPIEILVERLYKEKDKRPLIAHLANKEDLEDFIRKHLFERNYYYNQSSVILNAESKSIDTTVDEIIQRLK